ncbi:amidohydrolase [Streptomyces profundus]|uniref:amidohydrolase n=1 Tax=Streptomyces profundus TaxID=2867410 RepID=UPI001D16EF95|nr:amidohydrolase [Streptomyces sp. MA3_2.13]UED83934.1 amidohydrolase [Streptomyces sp. MA3_2.13]
MILSPANRPPDTVLLGGAVWVGDAAGSLVSGLAVTDGVVTALGTEDAVASLAGPATERVALDGRFVVPGFIDAHLHAIKGGMERRQCDLLGAATLAEVTDTVARYAAEHPAEPWVLGGGWSMDVFPRGIPHARLLDQLVPDRPALLYSRDHHTAWVNSAALRLAGIDAETPEPPGGRIDRDQDGTPCGALQERAMFLVSALLPARSREDWLAGLREAQRHLHALGVVGWQDAKVLHQPADAEVYAALADRGELTAHVVGAQWWEPDGGPAQLERLRAVRAEHARPGLRFDSVKLMLDGVCETHTAALLTPYVNLPEPDNHGIAYYDQRTLDETVAALDAAGFQAHFHTVGDAAVRQALDAVAHARRVNGDTGARHHLAHVQVVHPADVGRFRPLRVGVNAQPLWARHEPQMTELTIPYLGAERTGWQYPFGSLARSGAVLAIGSDWPVSTPDPLALLQVAVNRLPVPRPDRPGAPPEVFLPDERLTLKAAMNAYQLGSAYLNHSEHRHGSLELGKQADLVLLDRDPFAAPDQIWRATVLQTRVAGRVVFAR